MRLHGVLSRLSKEGPRKARKMPQDRHCLGRDSNPIQFRLVTANESFRPVLVAPYGQFLNLEVDKIRPLD